MTLIFPPDLFIFLYLCTFWLSWKVEKSKRMGEGIFEKCTNSACCNCVNITMLLDNYRIWRPMTMLHLFLWERIYSAGKGFALCCASMQMCVIFHFYLLYWCLLCSTIFFWCITLKNRFYTILCSIEHWSSTDLPTVLGLIPLHKSKKACVWIFKH